MTSQYVGPTDESWLGEWSTLFRNRRFSAALGIGLFGGVVMAGGLAIAGSGLLLVTQVDSVGGLALLATGFLLACVGIALPSALGTDLVVGSAPREKAGSAAAMSETSGEFGIALGVAVLGSLGAAVYRNQFADTIPAAVPSGGVETSRESITGRRRCHLPDSRHPRGGCAAARTTER